MALLKQITNNQGVVTNYHKIGSVQLREDSLCCFLDSYVSQEYREAEQRADSSMFTFTITLEEEESMGIRALCYSKIKEIESWTDAIDC